MAVQRQTAASKLASPFSREQHGVPEGGFPMTAWTNPSTSAQTPSLSVSIEQWFLEGVGGVTGGAGGLGQPQHALQKGDRVTRERMKMAAMSLVFAMRVCNLKFEVS